MHIEGGRRSADFERDDVRARFGIIDGRGRIDEEFFPLGELDTGNVGTLLQERFLVEEFLHANVATELQLRNGEECFRLTARPERHLARSPSPAEVAGTQFHGLLLTDKERRAIHIGEHLEREGERIAFREERREFRVGLCAEIRDGFGEFRLDDGREAIELSDAGEVDIRFDHGRGDGERHVFLGFAILSHDGLHTG